MLMKAVMPKKVSVKRNSGFSDIFISGRRRDTLYRRVRHFACTVRSR